ncbi:MAG: hypothetical protein COA42_22575 [Alteromonadaceae bacterium]|nr:MAG: hypothetical protein COA42_22575 [Alteromonadaceae bacterium]
MKGSGFKSQIKQIATEAKLSETELASLHTLMQAHSDAAPGQQIEDNSESEGRNSGRKAKQESYPLLFKGFGLGFAASMLFAVILFSGSLIYQQEDDIRKVVSKLASNHIKLKPLEVTTSRFAEIQNYFDKLDFIPIESSRLTHQTRGLLGGRYCSISSAPAAQLRYKSLNNQPITVYQAHYEEDIFDWVPDVQAGETPIVRNNKGLTISLWQEKGLVFARVEE